jgi:hypothetical protein
MKFAVISAALACITFSNAVPTNPGLRLEVREKAKGKCPANNHLGQYFL